MLYTLHFEHKGNIIKIELSIFLYLRQNHSAKTIEVSGIMFEYCAQYFSDTSGRVSVWERVWLSKDKYI